MTNHQALNAYNRVYGRSAAEIKQVFGGTVGYTYSIGDSFLKIYDKSLAVTPRCTEFFGERLAALRYLREATPLRDRICYPLSTADNGLFYEDDRFVYVAFNLISGSAIGWEREYSSEELPQLADIVTTLHAIPVDSLPLPREDFNLDFCDGLNALLSGGELATEGRFFTLMTDCRAEIGERISQAKELALSLKNRRLPYVICHTDIHGGNLMKASSGRLYLIDWENVILAPKEADLFSFCEKPYFNLFAESAAADNEALLYYLIRRDLEDIWEFLRTVLYDGADEKERDEIFGHLVRISAHLSGLDK